MTEPLELFPEPEPMPGSYHEESAGLPIVVRLELTRDAEFFWLKKIRDVNIFHCCAKCFLGEFDRRFFGTTSKQGSVVISEFAHDPRYMAYYLCGLSRGFVHARNTHLAFVPEPGEILEFEDGQCRVEIQNATRVFFEDYVPTPVGRFTDKQRACRNWIFANFLRDNVRPKGA